jgi:hypothetical protein
LEFPRCWDGRRWKAAACGLGRTVAKTTGIEKAFPLHRKTLPEIFELRSELVKYPRFL